LPSCRWMLEEHSRAILADDFVVRPGVIWTIEEVNTYGFYITQTGENIIPDYMGIEIYQDNGNKPGVKIYEHPYLSPDYGNFQGNITLTLPEPLTISAGKYWISIYATHESFYDDLRSYYIGIFLSPIGAQMHFLNEEDGPNWKPSDYESMYFILRGTKEGEATDLIYNVYRDGALLATLVNETSFTDEGFEVYKKHKWEVKVACESGGESNPESKTLEACICPVITEGKATFSEHSVTVTWNTVEGATGYKITRNGNSATITAPPFTEFGDFENGIEYTWTIVTLCENGESEPVEIKEIFLGIHDAALATFSIVPNPAQNKITISANIDFNKIEIINFLGQTVMLQSNDKNSAILDISHLNNGVYFVRVVSEKGMSVKKFVKQ